MPVSIEKGIGQPPFTTSDQIVWNLITSNPSLTSRKLYYKGLRQSTSFPNEMKMKLMYI